MSNATATPETMLPEMSIDALGKFLAGEEIADPAPKAVPAPVVETPAPEPPKAEPALEAAPVETPAAEPNEKPEGEEHTPEKAQEPKPKEKDPSWVDRRLSSLAHKRREAEARAQDAERRAEQFQRELEALKTAQPGPTSQAADKPEAASSEKPTLKSFTAALKEGEEYDDAVQRYTEAHDAWRDQQREARQQQKTIEEAKRTEDQMFVKDWQAALQQFPDIEDARDAVVAVASAGLQVAISHIRDDDGTALWPKLVMHLSEEPKKLAALSAEFAVNPYAATARLGRIAASLSSPPAPTPPAQKPPKAALKPPVSVTSTPTPAPVNIEETKDLEVVARELKRMGLHFPGF